MGITSGYPVGAKVASDLHKDNLCTKTEAERLIAFTNSSGPLFIIGAVGSGMFLDAKIGLLLFITHFLASITVGILFRKYKSTSETQNIIPQVSIKSNSNESLNLRNLGKKMGNAIQNSISTLLLICGYMVFFAVLSDVLINSGIASIFISGLENILSLFGIEKDLSTGIFCGILEITNGINKIALLDNTTYIQKIVTTALILGFGGFSVHMQVASIIAEANLSMKPYLIGKALQGIFASIYTYVLIKYTNFFHWDVVESFSYSNVTLKVVPESLNLLGTLLIIVSLGILIKIYIKIKRD